MTYFEDCKTAEECKKTYHKLAVKLHPDNGGDAEAFAKMQSEFEETFEKLKSVHMDSEGKTYTKETSETARKFMAIINALLGLGVEVEICGSWIWISGNTYPVREQLALLGCHWCKGKKKWCYHEGQHYHCKGRKSMGAIRATYGSEIIREASHVQLLTAN